MDVSYPFGRQTQVRCRRRVEMIMSATIYIYIYLLRYSREWVLWWCEDGVGHNNNNNITVQGYRTRSRRCRRRRRLHRCCWHPARQARKSCHLCRCRPDWCTWNSYRGPERPGSRASSCCNWSGSTLWLRTGRRSRSPAPTPVTKKKKKKNEWTNERTNAQPHTHIFISCESIVV